MYYMHFTYSVYMLRQSFVLQQEPNAGLVHVRLILCLNSSLHRKTSCKLKSLQCQPQRHPLPVIIYWNQNFHQKSISPCQQKNFLGMAVIMMRWGASIIQSCGLYKTACQNSWGLEIFLLGSSTCWPFNTVKGAVDWFYIVFFPLRHHLVPVKTQFHC